MEITPLSRCRHLRHWAFYLVTLLSFSAGAVEFRMRNFDDPDAEPWKEASYTLPPPPKQEDLLEFYVSATSTARFFIDAKSISVTESDGVVRYTLVVKTSGGATNVSYEGLHCAESAYKIYAIGKPNGTWAAHANPEWKTLKRISLNLHQSSLGRNYFCPNFVPIFTAEEGRRALINGQHPDSPGTDLRIGEGVR